MNDSPVVMLIVEDNYADVVFFQEAVAAAALSVDLRVVNNGGDAVEFLRRRGRFAEAPRPDVVILDLNLPVKSGREVMQDMMADESLGRIPVAILTTSTYEDDLATLYTPGRCEYFVKVPDFRQLASVAARIYALALKFRKPS